MTKEIKIIGDIIIFDGYEVAEIKKNIPCSVLGDFLDFVKEDLHKKTIDEIENITGDIDNMADDISNAVYNIQSILDKIRG